MGEYAVLICLKGKWDSISGFEATVLIPPHTATKLNIYNFGILILKRIQYLPVSPIVKKEEKILFTQAP